MNRKELIDNKKEYEKKLDKLWFDYAIGLAIICDYDDLKISIKQNKARVFRDKEGKHKIIID